MKKRTSGRHTSSRQKVGKKGQLFCGLGRGSIRSRSRLGRGEGHPAGGFTAATTRKRKKRGASVSSTGAKKATRQRQRQKKPRRTT
jgi:hypothetical protein